MIDQQQTNLAEVEYLDLESVTKVVNKFENPKIDENTFRTGVIPLHQQIKRGKFFMGVVRFMKMFYIFAKPLNTVDIYESVFALSRLENVAIFECAGANGQRSFLFRLCGRALSECRYPISNRVWGSEIVYLHMVSHNFLMD